MKLSKTQSLITLNDALLNLKISIRCLRKAQNFISKNIELTDYNKFLECKFMDVYLSSPINELQRQIDKTENLIAEIEGSK